MTSTDFSPRICLTVAGFIYQRVILMIMEDGGKYEGQLKGDKPNGVGTYTSKLLKYTGEWMNGEWDGQGECVYADGAVYKGQFSRNKKNGIGTLTIPKVSTYSGEWLGDLKHGQGTEKFNTGSSYKGGYS